MAKKPEKQKTKTEVEYTEYELLQQYEAVDWVKKGQTVEGFVYQIRTVEANKKQTRIMEIDTLKAESVAVWECAALKRLFSDDNIIGSQIKIVYQGAKKLKNKPQPMHDFKVWLKPGNTGQEPF